jgi:CBS domain-containing protein
MRAKEIMTKDPDCLSGDDTARRAAQVMRDRDCGCVPIVDGAGKVIGIVTDRDLAVRGIAAGKDTNTKLNDLMTPVATTCSPDDDLRDVEQKMAELQVRRIPIVDAAGRCLGIISQADIALAAGRNSTVTDREIALVVEQISQPNGRGTGGRDPNFGFDESGVAPQF